MKTRKLVFIVLLLILVALAFLLYKNYPYIEANYYNRYINVSGVKLMMTEEEMASELSEKGELVPGMGGHAWDYEKTEIFISISDHGMFRDKVCQIDTQNPSHEILGIKAGDSFDEALELMGSKGFKQISDDFFTKGNVFIQLFGGTTISRLRIGIEDLAYKDVVF